MTQIKIDEEIAHVIVQDINADYPKVYIVKPYPEMTEEIRKALEDMSIGYPGIMHFVGVYKKDKKYYLSYADHNSHVLTKQEVNDAYLKAGSPKCVILI